MLNTSQDQWGTNTSLFGEINSRFDTSRRDDETVVRLSMAEGDLKRNIPCLDKPLDTGASFEADQSVLPRSLYET